jgi:hypothetical protein
MEVLTISGIPILEKPKNSLVRIYKTEECEFARGKTLHLINGKLTKKNKYRWYSYLAWDEDKFGKLQTVWARKIKSSLCNATFEILAVKLDDDSLIVSSADYRRDFRVKDNFLLDRDGKRMLELYSEDFDASDIPEKKKMATYNSLVSAVLTAIQDKQIFISPIAKQKVDTTYLAIEFGEIEDKYDSETDELHPSGTIEVNEFKHYYEPHMCEVTTLYRSLVPANEDSDEDLTITNQSIQFTERVRINSLPDFYIFDDEDFIFEYTLPTGFHSVEDIEVDEEEYDEFIEANNRNF